jgi:hypothetical protein
MANADVISCRDDLTRQERKMLEEGWISCRMAAAKLGVSIITIHRLVYDGKIKERDVQMVGKTKFIKLAAFVATQTKQVQDTFELGDWSEYA